MSGICCPRGADLPTELESVCIQDEQETVAADAYMGAVTVELVPDLSTSYTGIAATRLIGELNGNTLFQKCPALGALTLVIGLLCFPKQRAKAGNGIIRTL